MKRIILFTALLLSIFSCSQPTKKVVQEITIEIQPFVGFSERDAKYIASEIMKIYPKVTVKAPINFPQTAFNKERKRYRADSLITFLATRTTEKHVTIGLTDNDISTTKGPAADWGVMGLGFCPGKACIASTFRLAKDQKIEQLFKVAIHELGHTQGLPHCVLNTCFMRDAEGKNPTNEEKEFCIGCKQLLVERGWILK